MYEDIRKHIIETRTKYCEPILELLAEEELYHGDLADKLNISPSGLNVIIKKMQEGEPPLIEVAQIGKYKIYSLPSMVKEYILNKKNTQKTSLREDNNEPERENLLLSLQHFVEKVGAPWKDMLNLLLQGEEDKIEENVREQYEQLMRKIVFASKYNEEALVDLKKFINNDVLNYLLDCYLDELEQCEKILERIRQGENGKKLARHFKIE